VKKSVRTLVALLFVLVVASSLFVASVAAGTDVPIQGTLEGSEQGVNNFPIRTVTGSATGNANHLGLYMVTYINQVHMVTLYGTGTATFVAANGDILFTDVVGQGTLIAPTIVSVAGTYTITGGTGRFEGATGSFSG
jgi:hypothetical protein